MKPKRLLEKLEIFYKNLYSGKDILKLQTRLDILLSEISSVFIDHGCDPLDISYYRENWYSEINDYYLIYLKNCNLGYLVKVAKDKKGVDNVVLEFTNRKRFYYKYLEGLINLKISKNIVIPEFKDISTDGAFIIGRIQGETLYSRSLRKVLESKLIQLESLFNDNEIRILMEKGVCGKEKLPSLGSLYEDPDYEFLSHYK